MHMWLSRKDLSMEHLMVVSELVIALCAVVATTIYAMKNVK